MVDQHEDASDVLQNCFIKAYRNIGSFRGNAKLYTWLYRIAKNEAITFLNNKKRRYATSMDQEGLNLGNRLTADTHFDSQQAQHHLQVAIEQLPDKQKQVFNMRYYDELTYNEMSGLLKTSVGALKASFHHAVKKVESYLLQTDIF